MINAAPHYLLISESKSAEARNQGGRWRFVLDQIGGSHRQVVSDSEPDVSGERLQLLAVIRGLESLDQPSRITLLTSSQYVTRGIRRGLPYWRENNFCWEKFGRMSRIKNDDMWRRLDRALHIHRVECRNWKVLAETAPSTDSLSTNRIVSPPVSVEATGTYRGQMPAAFNGQVRPMSRKQAMQHRVDRWWGSCQKALKAVPSIMF